MNSRLNVFLSAALIAVLVTPLLVSARQPNIVLILADDLGFIDISPFGSEIDTPSIARLAAEGLSFTNYHTADSPPKLWGSKGRLAGR